MWQAAQRLRTFRAGGETLLRQSQGALEKRHNYECSAPAHAQEHRPAPDLAVHDFDDQLEPGELPDWEDPAGECEPADKFQLEGRVLPVHEVHPLVPEL